MKLNKSSRDWDFRLKDILHAIHKIEVYTKDMTLHDFKKNELVVDAVIRNFEIIGEASSSIPASIQKNYSNIPWKQMSELRNFLIHEYFGVDISIIWETVNHHLPLLKEQLLEASQTLKN